MAAFRRISRPTSCFGSVHWRLGWWAISPAYPAGSVRALLYTDAVNPPTRDALQARLGQPAVAAPAFFTVEEFATLRAVCARLLPDPRIDVAGPIDTRLASGEGDGWRYDSLPPDGEAFRQVLATFDQAAQAGSGIGFTSLDPAHQDEVLRAAQPGSRVFEDLLAEAAEVYFAHPLAQEDIGYAGMADAPGWRRIGLDEREAREPDAV